ncbi:UNVERIFIED_CONTAM: Primary amine oxidase, partial [Sesamum angustifolium]
MRVGPVISLASIYDHDMRKYRRVMYRGYASEMFVPYQDLSEEWYFRTFLDAGEFGVGICAVPLQPNTDCPPNAVFMDGYYTTRDGTPVKTPNVFCVFERYAGDIMWRHSETILPGDTVEVRPDVTLVVRMVSTVANYDIMDWEFKQSGSIKITTSLSGILAVKASAYKHKDQIQEEVYGTIVAENTIGTCHSHYLSFYLDLDIDGDANSLKKAHLQSVRVTDGSSPRKSHWTVVDEVAKTESDAKIRLGLGDQTEIIVVNPNKRTNVGNNIGYRLIPGPLAGAYIDRARGDDTIAKWTL